MASITSRGELVPISQGRLATWIARRGLTANEVARRAGMSRQRLSLLVTGKVSRCRREDRRQLARVLGVSVSLLAGDEAPDVSVEEMGVQSGVNSAIRSPMYSRGKRRDAEVQALLMDVNALTPLGTRKPTTDIMEPIWRAKEMVTDATMALDLTALRSFLYGSAEYPTRETDEELEAFSGDVGRVIHTLLEPWTKGDFPKPPKGLADASAILRVALGLVYLRARNEAKDRPALRAIITELEAIADRLRVLNFGAPPGPEEMRRSVREHNERLGYKGG